MLHLLPLQPILPLDGTPLVQRAPSSSVWVAVEVTVAGVSQSHRESDPLTESSVCTPTEQVAIAATELLGRTGWLSSEPVPLAVSCLGLARSNCCLSGSLSSDPADFAPVLLAASVLELTP